MIKKILASTMIAALLSSGTDGCETDDGVRMRANRTASDYNNFILKNNYVWKNDVPSDIFDSLPYIE